MNFELTRVTATDDVYKHAGLFRVMQPGQDYLWPESAVGTLTVEGMQHGVKYFSGVETRPLYLDPAASAQSVDEIKQLWREVMRTDPDKYLKPWDLNRNGLQQGAYQPPARKIWDGVQSLDGRRVLLCGAYSIGDQLWYTHTLHLLKQKYPRAVLYTLTYAGYGDGVWSGNEEVNELQLPITPAAFEAFDFYIPLLSIIAANVDVKQSRKKKTLVQADCTPYEIFADMLNLRKQYDAADAKPRVQCFDAAWRSFCEKITVRFFAAWANIDAPIEPQNYVVVQLHTQRAARDFTALQLAEIVRALRAEFPRSLIFCIGNDAKGVAAWNDLAKEVDPEALKIVPIISGTESGSYTFPELAALTAHAMITVCPDSMLSHLSAAFDVPNVTVYGPYAAKWRAETYAYCVPVEAREACKIAPCSWPGDGFPAACVSRETNCCAVVASASGARVIESVRAAMEKKRAVVPEWGAMRAPEDVVTQGETGLALVEETANA